MPNRLCPSIRPLLAGMAFWLAVGSSSYAQFKDDVLQEGKPGEIVTERWRVGMEVTAEGGAFRRIVGATTVPTDWPEQRVRAVAEDLSPGVAISYQTFEGVGKQMTVKIPALAANDPARAVVTFEVRRFLPPRPEDTTGYVAPEAKKSDRKLAVHLQPGPFIESNHPDVKKLAEQVSAKHDRAWDKAEAMYDWVREHVEFKDNQGQGVKDVLETLNDGHGDCDEMSSVFIAMCRSLGIPARMIRVPKHVYAEFYLLDGNDRGQWFPCQVSGTRGFGAIVDPRPIMQKGDNIVSAAGQAKKKTRSRFLPDNLMGFPAGPGGQLKLKLICERAG